MNENNQQQHTTTPTHSWGVITEVGGGFNGEPAQQEPSDRFKNFPTNDFGEPIIYDTNEIDEITGFLTGDEGEEDSVTVLHNLVRYLNVVHPGKTMTQVLIETEEAALAAQQQETVAERLMDCDHCGGTGVDGDVDDRGRTFDVQCRACAGSGKSRYLGRCTNGRRCLQGCLSTDGCYWEKRAAKEQPAQQQEPFGQVTVVRRPGCVDQHWFYRWPEPPYLDNAAECHTVYTSPPASKPWVGLTDEEIEQAFYDFDVARTYIISFARAIEAKLKDKNGY